MPAVGVSLVPRVDSVVGEGGKFHFVFVSASPGKIPRARAAARVRPNSAEYSGSLLTVGIGCESCGAISYAASGAFSYAVAVENDVAAGGAMVSFDGAGAMDAADDAISCGSAFAYAVAVENEYVAGGGCSHEGAVDDAYATGGAVSYAACGALSYAVAVENVYAAGGAMVSYDGTVTMDAAGDAIACGSAVVDAPTACCAISFADWASLAEECFDARANLVDTILAVEANFKFQFVFVADAVHSMHLTSAAANVISYAGAVAMWNASSLAVAHEFEVPEVPAEPG
jgi:hypothetical protein